MTGSQLDPDELATQALAHMRLGGVRQAGSSAVGQQQQSQQQRERPGGLSLAAVLLPEFLKGHRAVPGQDLVQAFASYLLHGGCQGSSVDKQYFLVQVLGLGICSQRVSSVGLCQPEINH